MVLLSGIDLKETKETRCRKNIGSKEREFQKVFEGVLRIENVYRLEPSGQKHFRVGLSVGKSWECCSTKLAKRQIRAVLQELKTDANLQILLS